MALEGCPHGLNHKDECAYCLKLKVKKEDGAARFDTVREMELNEEHFLKPKRGFEHSSSIRDAARGLEGSKK